MHVHHDVSTWSSRNAMWGEEGPAGRAVGPLPSSGFTSCHSAVNSTLGCVLALPAHDMYRHRAAYYPGLGTALGGDHSMPILAANCASGHSAALRDGAHQGTLPYGVELLGPSGSPVLEVDAQLLHVLVEEGHGHVLRAEITGVLRTLDLVNGKEPPRHLLLVPEDIHLDVPDLVGPRPMLTRRSAAPKSLRSVAIPSPSAEALTTAYSSDYPGLFAIVAWVLE